MKLLNRQLQEWKKGLIRRVCIGVYDKPKFSILFQEYAVPNPDEVAHAKARNYNWIIAGTGNTALNQFGLSTQVPAKWSYISSEPYKNILLVILLWNSIIDQIIS